MVLQATVGKRRNFGLVVLLGIITLGIYWYVWMWKSHSEVHRQFELQNEGRSKGTVWFILGFFTGITFLVYYWIWASNVQYVRRRLGMSGGITPGILLAIMLVPFVIMLGLAAWLVVTVLSNPAGSTTMPEAWKVPMLSLQIGGFVCAIITLAGLGWLQSNVNSIWTSFAQSPGMWNTGAQAAPGAAMGTPFVAPEPLSRLPGSKRLKCPRCATLVWVGPGEKPYCHNCGFGTPPPPKPMEEIPQG